MNIWYKSENTPLDEKNLTADARENKDFLVTKESIVFMGMGNDDISSSDIRVPVKSVIRYKALNTFWGHFAIMDIDSYRQCLGYINADATAELSKDKKKLMTMEGSDLDSMFGAENLIVGNKGNADISDVSFRKKDTDNAALKTDPDTGTYNLVLVKLKPGVSLSSGYKKLGRTLGKNNLGVHPITWENASGMIGTMASIIQTAMLTFAIILFLVAIIIIVNTLSMAAIERTTEIGMMRAVGAQKGFIAKMFMGETAILAAVFGGLGIIAGSFIVKTIPAMHLTSDNDMVQLIYGGDTFLPAIGIGSIFLLILALFIVTTIAAAYPVKVARSITPLDAISRD
jgi:putative ABC transport system permease protein